MVINDTITITVPESQADWAQRLLGWAGVTTGGEAIDELQPRRAAGPGRQDPEREQGHGNELRDIVNFRLW